MIDVVIVFDADCPNVETARQRLSAALAQLGLPQRWRELDRTGAEIPEAWRSFASPTVLIDGHDVAAGAAGHAACRLYRDADGRLDVAPAVDVITSALGRLGDAP